MCIFMCFYDKKKKKTYFFHNECVDSSKPTESLNYFRET